MGWSYGQLMELPDHYLDVLEKWIVETEREQARAMRAAAQTRRRY